MSELSKNYNPKEVEEKWLKEWESKKIFASKIDPSKESFSIALPPPNVTGNLHMGHAFGDTIQDVLIRYHKMNGKNVLWQAGTDHAGIGTQILVEKDLGKTEKKRKEDIGREEFLKRVWIWKEKHGNQIIDQMKKLGCFIDYDRLVFTMDEHHTKAVNKAFVDLYKKGLIYRGKRIVNWCPKCSTSLSDLEVENESIKGKLYHILYPFDINDVSKGGITVATTRPETMFGDVSVAINPNDGRYKKLVGKKVFIPVINKEIPIIADEIIKMDFGTGAVKTTPAHDSNDFDIFERHKDILKEYSIILDKKGKIQDPDSFGIPTDIVGLDRFKAREITLEKLTEIGVLIKTEEYDQTIDKHDRCGTQIEPYLSDQWYVRMDDPNHSLAKKAIDAVERDKKIEFIPERYTDLYLNWLKNIRDWCISRQLWWGHRIPVWYKKNSVQGSGHSVEDVYVGEEPPKDIENYIQDPDVLDTWFSSALWPYATLGWPQETDYLKNFFPTSILATAREIINLWVSRMIFTSLEFTGEVPFKKVLIHPVIQTPDGKRMSKSKGNAIDPLEMIDKYGADANRFWYFSVGIAGNQDVRFPGRKGKDGWESDTLETYKRFANKLWNAVRFVMQNLELGKKYSYSLKNIKYENLTIADKWILNKYINLISNVEKYFNDYRFSNVSDELYKFIWDEFCDWYIEIAKKQFNDTFLKLQTQEILFYIINGIVRLLHPVMPFITEEIWSNLPCEDSDESVICFKYPEVEKDFFNPDIDKSFSHVIEITRAIRNLRQTIGIPWSQEIQSKIYSECEFEKNALVSSIGYIATLIKGEVIIEDSYSSVKPSTGILVSNTRITIPLSGLVDIDNMINSFNKRKSQFLKEMEQENNKLKNENFIKNAPQDKIDEVKRRILDFENQINAIDEQIGLLK